MEVVEQGEIWKDVGDELEFDHTEIILKQDSEYFYARTSHRLYRSLEEIDSSHLEIYPIRSADIWPPFSDELTRAPDPLPVDVFLKRPSLISAGDTDFRPGELLVEEAHICEILLKHPHPHIARYLGCQVRENKITGLCFAKYKRTLADIFLDKVCTLSPDTCSKIENGIAHLHSLGLVHNDLNPANIMFSEDDIPVIIDFDSCRREGENLLKAGTPGWSDESAIVADRANDYYGLTKIKEVISGLQNENKTAG
jgi:hypothetical protein